MINLDINLILSSKEEIKLKSLPNENLKRLEFAYYTVSKLVVVGNNAGAIYMLRNKPESALLNFLKVILSRIQF